jgi:PAS domain S-box-containing protein
VTFAARLENGVRPAGVAWLFVLGAVAAVAGSFYVFSVSRIAPHPVGQGALSAIVCFAFVGAGAYALRLRPYARFGVLLAAVGFTSLISVLHDANHPIPYTIGVLASNVVFAVIVHALLAFPKGRLHAQGRRLLVAAAYVDVLALQAVAVLFDPLTRYHSDHPRNVVLVAAHPTLATGLLELEAAIAAALALIAVVVLSRQARSATAAARRQLQPVLAGGKVALLLFSLGLVLTPLSSRAGLVGFGLGLLAALAIPAAFVVTLVQGRLSRAAVGELLLELRDPGEEPDLEESLRRALGDPTLRLGRLGAVEDEYLDSSGELLRLPVAGEAQVATPILHHGEPIGTLVHDRSLRLRPELLDAVGAAAGFALANERALRAAELVEERNRALLDAIPDPMIRVARDGTYLDVRPDDALQLLLPAEELVGRNVRDVLPQPLADEIVAWIEHTLATGSLTTFEYELEVDGRRRRQESRMMPSGPDEAVTILRDFTEQRRAESELRRLAAEQAALRRVATLVAGNARPEEVFQTVTEEVCRLLGLRTAVLHRFESATTSTIVGTYGMAEGGALEFGSEIELEFGAARRVLETGAAARCEYEELGGRDAAELLRLGFVRSVGVPITVAGATWGALVVVLREDETLPIATEHRLAAFAELVALAVASAHARDELSASRLRIVEASDTERRRLERNLHDGAQQRLVALSVGLRLVQAKLRASPEESQELLAALAEELAAAIVELRELAQGIHPAVLTERGLGAALEVLAARAPLPVSVDVDLPERLPEHVETAAYYAVSEALANVVKHAAATSAAVRVERLDGRVAVEVSDDGAGGADAGRGTGLSGLRDRVETLDGVLWIDSPSGGGTLLRAELPVGSDSLAPVGRDG